MAAEDVRIYIGNILPKLAQDPENLARRLAKYGQIVAPLELHTKPVQTHYFAYITINTEFDKIRKAFHNIEFMGMKLSVARAKPAAFLVDRDEVVSHDRVQKERSKRIREYSSHVHINPESGSAVGLTGSAYGYSKPANGSNGANTKNTPSSSTVIGSKSYGALTVPTKVYNRYYSLTSGAGDVVYGRFRKTPRPKDKLKKQTLRVLVNGDLKTFASYKTKLWGVTHKPATELTFVYDDNLKVWKSGDNHVLERLPELARSEGEKREGPEDEQDKLKALKVLSGMFESYDFDKKVDMEEDSEEERGYDYEAEHEAQLEDVAVDFDIIDKVRNMGDGAVVEEKYYSEDDEGNELDFDQLAYTTEAYQGENDKKSLEEEEEEEEKEKEEKEVEKEEVEEEEKEEIEEEGKEEEIEEEEEEEEEEEGRDEQEEEKEEEDEDHDDEFMPSFGTAPTANAPSGNTTEVLRGLFTAENIQETVTRPTEIIKPKKSLFGLFWVHPESAFLQTQTQLSKLGFQTDKLNLPEKGDSKGDSEESPYEQWFWSMRGEVTRECKRRKRDVQRTKRR